jgi:hypothetical protein
MRPINIDYSNIHLPSMALFSGYGNEMPLNLLGFHVSTYEWINSTSVFVTSTTQTDVVYIIQKYIPTECDMRFLNQLRIEHPPLVSDIMALWSNPYLNISENTDFFNIKHLWDWAYSKVCFKIIRGK